MWWNVVEIRPPPSLVIKRACSELEFLARRRAAELGIAIVGQTFISLVRTIQRLEGSPPCFATGRARCSHVECAWRPCCLEHRHVVPPWDPFE